MADTRQSGKLKSALGPSADCPPLPELAAALEAAADDERRPAAERHLASCGWCRQELALAREFTESQPRPGEAQDVRWIVRRLERQSAVPRARRPLARLFGLRPLLTAACVLVIAAGVLYMRRGPGALPISGIGDGVMRSSGIELIAPVGDLPRPPAAFQWRTVAGAARYRLRLMEVDRREIWRGEVAGSSATVPADVLASITPGKVVLWDVAALDASGNTLATSSPVSFRIAR